MSFYESIQKFRDFDFDKFFGNLTDLHIEKALNSPKLDYKQFLMLLSPLAEKYLEEMAQRAHKISLQNFGRTIQLYTPIYLSNYCVNQCVYCGFNENSRISRKKLSINEVEKEARIIAEKGLKHVLLLTGESREMSSLSYIKNCISVLKKYFSSISLEIYPLKEEEYKEMIEEGVDGLTIYQEVYDQDIYSKLHPKGPKRDYRPRLDTPENAASAGIRTINIGALLGLNDWIRESFFTGMHAKYLQDKYTDTEVSISVPRVRTQNSHFNPQYTVSDKNLVQIILAVRIFLSRVGVTLSTREGMALRDNLVPLGVTKMSAGSVTSVGGRIFAESEEKESAQFDILDNRDINEVGDMLLQKGYQPVLKDWMLLEK